MCEFLATIYFRKSTLIPLYLKSSFWYTSNRLQGKMDDVSCLHLALVKYMRATCHVFEWFWYFPFISNIHTLIFTILLRHIFFSLQQYNMCNSLLIVYTALCTSHLLQRIISHFVFFKYANFNQR